MKKNVLFVCVHNSSRSQMAECLMREMLSDKYNFFSAGFTAGEVHPHTRTVLREIGINCEGLAAKGFESLEDIHFDIVISVCDKEVEQCPLVIGETLTVNLPFVDPAGLAATLPEEDGLQVFRNCRSQIRQVLRNYFLIIESKEKQRTDKEIKQEIESDFQLRMTDYVCDHIREFNKISTNLDDKFVCIRRNDLKLFLKEELEDFHETDIFSWFALTIGLVLTLLTSTFDGFWFLTDQHLLSIFSIGALAAAVTTVLKVLKNKRSNSRATFISNILSRIC